MIASETNEIARYAGHWECVLLFANGEWHTAESLGYQTNYMGLYGDGHVVDSRIPGVAGIHGCSVHGNDGLVSAPDSLGEEYDQILEFEGDEMRVHFRDVYAKNFFVYRRIGEAPVLEKHPDLTELSRMIYFGQY